MRACDRLPPPRSPLRPKFIVPLALASAFCALAAADAAFGPAFAMSGMRGHFGGPGGMSMPRTAAPTTAVPGPRGLSGPGIGGSGDRIRTLGAKSTDRRPSGGKFSDRHVPPGGEGRDPRPPQHPHRPHKPGGPGVIVSVPGGPPADVVPTTSLGGAGHPPSGPGNQLVRPSDGVPPVDERRNYMPGEVVVEVAGSPSDQAIEQLARRHRLARLESLSFRLSGTTVYRWRIPDRRSVPAVVRALEADASVRAAQPNFISFLQEQRPSGNGLGDPAQYAPAKLQLPQAHTLARGDNVLIAVIDSGIDGTHPELAGMIEDTFDAIVTGDKVHSHGTGIAGAIVAHARLMGIAPAARILAVRAFAGARGSEGTTFAILKGLDWATGRGARIVNMSFAAGQLDPVIGRSLAAAHAKGIVLIAAAGNAGPKSRPLYPAADPNVIAVTATDADDKLFPAANRGSHIAVAAPGVDLLLPSPGTGYQMTSGTSFAAAEVSGAVALLLQRNPDLDPDTVRRTLMSTARDLGPKGFDPEFGAGLVDAYQAILSVAPSTVGQAAVENRR
jgi:Subtilase family